MIAQRIIEAGSKLFTSRTLGQSTLAEELHVQGASADALYAPPAASFSGFAGLDQADQRLAGAGIYANTRFSLEPPDQGPCVGSGFTMEVINNALMVYIRGGLPVIAPVPTNELFGLAPELIRNTNPLLNVYGPSLSDTRCYYDRDTQRKFVSEFEQDINPVTGAGLGRTALFIAISQTSEPTGSYNVLTLDTTDANHVGCPCLPDQPLLGADANARTQHLAGRSAAGTDSARGRAKTKSSARPDRFRRRSHAASRVRARTAMGRSHDGSRCRGQASLRRCLFRGRARGNAAAY